MIDSATCLPQGTDILIAGFGPSGATLAALLGHYGIRTLVIDKSPDILMMPRAIALDNEALRVLQMAGLNEQAFAKIPISEVKMHCPITGEFGRANTRGSLDGHPKLVTFYQPELEKALREKVQTFDSVTFCGGYELVEFTQDAHRVLARVVDEAGKQHEILTSYLVGADGAGSIVRSLIGEDFKGKTYAEDWLIVDARQRKGQAIDHVEFNCDPARPVPHMPAPGGRERWEFMLKPGEDSKQMEDPETISQLLEPWVKGQEIDIERTAVYRFHARCCENFSKDRVFLVGDAAHITPPFVGQGLVAGLRDVANLAWKLAWVVQDKASPKILDSYDQERRPHARKMIELARFMGHMVMTRNTLSATFIHGLMRLARTVPWLGAYLEELKIKPANRFESGLFLKSRNCRALPDGGQIRQGWLRWQNNIQLSDDVLGRGFTLIGFGCNPDQLLSNNLKQHWRSMGGNLLALGMQNDNTDTMAEDLNNELSEGVPVGWLAIVRPDRIIMTNGPAKDANHLVEQSLFLLKA